ncbi:MAG: dienelactone hydrolase family protein [Alphaproteobacteria bacterium]|nr:dienelactone hydrolase family protein [Alphaproteobacteria bacterium]
MGTWIELTAADGHRLTAYHSPARGQRRAGLVVLQEIFGVNRHMRRVADEFAADGYEAIAPALFDRAERGVELDYAAPDMDRGRALRAAIALDGTLGDIAAAAAQLAPAGKVGVVGYCWGGSLAWFAATRLRVDAAAGYYGAMVAQHTREAPRCPVMLHFGEHDKGIPLADVATVRAAQPGVPIHVYPADHGFNCDDRRQYDPPATKLARERTLAFFAQHLV